MASVSVTVLPEITGAVLLSVRVVCEPLGPFFTVKAELARLPAAPRSSLRVITSVVPLTVAEANVGAAVSWLT